MIYGFEEETEEMGGMVTYFYFIAGTSFWSKYHLSAKYLGLLKLSSKPLDADFIVGPLTRISCISAILIALL